MALMHEDKRHGFRIRYRVRSIEDTFIDKSRFFKSKPRAALALREIEDLEKLSLEQKLTSRQIAYYVYKKLLTVFDARSLTRERVCRLNPFEAAMNETGKFF